MNKPWKKIKKTIKAPPYFKEMQKLISKAEKEVADMLGVSTEWLREQNKKEPKVFKEVVEEFAEKKGWGEHELYKIRFLLNSTSVFVKYAWTRFIAEHIDDEFGKVEPDLLTYDEKNDEIVIKWFVSRTRKAIRKIIRPIKSIFIPNEKGKFKRKIIKW